MNKLFTVLTLLVLGAPGVFAQTDSIKGTFWKPVPRMYEAKQAVEVESLFPMFFSGGYHVGVGYRYEKFRFRLSLINGGTYDAEPAGTKNSSPEFKRYYKTSPGFFFGYNVWRNLEVYSFVELHTFEIEQVSTGLKQDIHSTDFGGGISYQFFIGRHIYLQPGVHIYLRADNSADFNGTVYNIPNVDLAPVIRIGYRLWSKY
ncbi:hypothetical protein [Flavobacterium nackdongense]|uniref:DUF3575 domain-containing protein n=1 Tax=Flavobacterium nackdongense TaxID=2547394 RepID=A0A4P6Y7S9_9FLAO|nr:hypothetical protein [Flavobacterium nackdongense]QBN17738.1 hypothetical protein E1750_02605 [Flavobacterium nackdongense]